MKKLLKIGCLGFIILMILIVIIMVAGGGDEEPVDTEDTDPTETEENDSDTNGGAQEGEQPEKDDVQPVAEDGVLTEEKFNQIENGMTYEKVEAIIGSEGTVISESGEPGTEFHTVMYEWETDGVFAAANFMFQGGKLTNKSQFGVNEQSDVTVTLDEFNRVQNGMTYEEVVEIVGGEGTILSETGEKGTEFYTVMYEYLGEGEFGANANFMFQGGKLANKSQYGLQ